ncbi:hypothetical protein FHL15_009632 [Xylaria flabelliformis]|uniref:Uncharacterized protein n=1 Tax=Xylaria flabelliformis TaxID=2512241 RepID=A0A553HNC5_9PEZI|nr:hypothetical protein FHL15_009632 [Xylaria flabelliformis]
MMNGLVDLIPMGKVRNLKVLDYSYLTISPDARTSGTKCEPSTSGQGSASSSTGGTTSAERKKKQDEDLIAIGAQFWGLARSVKDDDYGYPTELSLDDTNETKSK